mmetsp:Transcript_4414/g.9948  ORF Transcript_4414/g.9948 Transcript_4414/m.9948 type:complete len:450 (-) Transcript_4414:110-1459(-)
MTAGHSRDRLVLTAGTMGLSSSLFVSLLVLGGCVQLLLRTDVERVAKQIAVSRVGGSHCSIQTSKVESLPSSTSFANECAAVGLSLDGVANGSRSDVEKYIALLYRLSERTDSELPPITNKTAPPMDPIDCSAPMFAGERSTPATVIDLMPFNGEFVAVEVRLYELLDLVDMHIVLESPSSHHMFRKPLVLARRMEYLQDFWDKIFLLYDDDSDVQNAFGDRFNSENKYPSKVDWRMEGRMRPLIWRKAKAFVKHLNATSNGIVYISGDPDEIPDRNMINHFKHCKPARPQFSYKYHQIMYRHNFQFVTKGWDHGSVFGGINNPDQTRKPNLLRDGKDLAPVKWTGFHLNRVTDVYVDFAKELTISEGGSLAGIGRACSQSGNITEALLNPLLCNQRRNHGSRICCKDYPGLSVSSVPDPRPEKYRLPWIVEQNRDHFWPYFPPFAPEE